MGSAGRWRRWEFKSFARDVDRIQNATFCTGSNDVVL
jgi:hypothetical protein